MSANAKIYEAREHCKAAEKATKTTMFRWKADFDSAADEYSQAAQCYRIARDLPNSKECHLKASECYRKNHAFFHAAKALENAIIVCKEIAPPEEIYNLAVESASLYQQHGSGDSGASVLDKAAKILEDKNLELAVKLFQQAADVSSGETYEPSAMQINHLLNYIASNLPTDSLKLSSEQFSKWHKITKTLNDLWGPSKTLEEWVQILADLKIQEGFENVSGAEAVSNNQAGLMASEDEQVQETVKIQEDEQDPQTIRIPEDEQDQITIKIPQDEPAIEEIIPPSLSYASTSGHQPHPSTSWQQPCATTSWQQPYASSSREYRHARVTPVQSAAAVSESKSLETNKKRLAEFNSSGDAKRKKKDRLKTTLENIYKNIQDQQREESHEDPHDGNIFGSDPDEVD